MFIWESLFIWAKPRKTMQGYSRCRADYIDLLSKKYAMEEEVLWCLGTGEQDTDYRLCNGDWDLLPKLYTQDTVIYEYNQNKWTWSISSCTIFAAIWMASDLWNYEFSEQEINEINELSYARGRVRGKWWYVQSAVKLVNDRWNGNEELVKKYWKMAFYRVSKYDNDIIEDAIGKLYTIDWNYCPTAKYNQDRADWMIDGTDFWYNTNWHSVDVRNVEDQRSVKDSYVGRKYNIYWLAHKLSEITNYWPYFYIYTKVKEDNLERVKKLNKIKALIQEALPLNSQLWEETWSQEHKDKLHEMNNFLRGWQDYIDSELKTLM